MELNRLKHETSPYLLQHSNNPVHWYPWGKDAFEKAKEENKPVLLSVGYSTCHWCHVMNRESFQDLDVANFLNENYIAIKVDREERPDIDSIYMQYCQLATGQGGWPLTVLLTSDQKPFFAGTYFPKENFLGLLSQVKTAWSQEKDKILQTGVKSTLAMEQMSKLKIVDLKETLLEEAYNHFQKEFDNEYGGFGTAPKFPSPHQLLFLLRYYKKTEDNQALYMVEKTLEGMYKGGIFDHVGFGFSRYSTDKKWLVPHFEKMLYDNAMLLMVLTEAFQLTGKDLYRELVDRVATYVIRDMTHEEGGYFSAEDADTEGKEGLYYLWSKEEIMDILGPEDGSIYCNYYNITDEGNFEGLNIPNMIGVDLDEIEEDKGLNSRLYEMNKRLLMHRTHRQKPHKDDKVLTSWNGLMIAAMAKAGRVFQSCDFTNSAERAYWFIENRLCKDGTLKASYRDEQASQKGFLMDYAYLAWGLLELYEATFNYNFLAKSKHYTDYMLKMFWDEASGGFYLYGDEHEQLITKPKEAYDGALPSGNSVAALVLTRLGRYFDKPMYEEKAKSILGAFSYEINQIPYAHAMLLATYMYLGETINRIIITGNPLDDLHKEYLQEIHGHYHPFYVTLYNDSQQSKHLPEYLEHYDDGEDKRRVFICHNNSCLEPVEDLDKLKVVLGTL